MEAPYTLASLPTPLDALGGSIHTAPVFGLRGAKKRKRHEVAVGIDGEGVNLYSVQTHSLTTSYALPPQSYLCCPPCTIYCRSLKPAPAQRRTYVVLRDGAEDTKRRMVCYTENVGGSTVTDGGLAGGAKVERKLQAGDVLGLDALPRGGTNGTDLDIIVNYKTGRTECLTGDLSRSLWEQQLESVSMDASSSDEVEYSVVTDLETARKGLLAGREDVLALHDAALSGGDISSTHSLLCQIVRSQRKRTLRLYFIRSSDADGIQSQRAALQQVLSYELPATKKQSTDPAVHELHVATGKLHQLLDGRLVSYDLTGTTPRIASILGSTFKPIESFARLSSSSICTILDQRAAIYETKYGSMQASLPLSSTPTTAARSGEKRKHADGVAAPLRLIACYSDLSLVLGLSGTQLQVLQLQTDLREAKRTRTNGTLLIDVLGKSDTSGGKVTDDHERSEKRAKRWEEWTRKVDEAAGNDYPQELENLTAQALGLKRKPLFSEQQDSSMQDFASGGTMHEIPWDLDPASVFAGLADHRKVVYLLSRCFRVEGDDYYNRMVFTASSVLALKMLALAGFLSTAYCQQAQQHQRHDTTGPMPLVPSGSILSAISRFDNDFQLMHDMLTLPVHWGLQDMVSALRLLIQSFDTQINDNPDRLALPAPEQQQLDGTRDVTMADDADAQSNLELESLAAEKELNFALSALSSGLELRSQTLRLILGRLRAFPRKSVTKAMRKMMSHKDLIFFIQILRIELADGGWTSRYVDKGEDDDESDVAPWMAGAPEANGPSDQAIKAIGELLNSAIDAIGTTGFLVGLSADSYSVQDLIVSLRTEVSAGLEGLYEVDVLGSALRDLERYSIDAERVRSKRALPDGEESHALPLGFRSEASVIGGKVNGKEVRKSRHLFGKEKSMRVGKYSIDRVRI